MQPRIRLAFWAASTCCQVMSIHQSLQVLLDKAVLNPFIPQPVLIAGVAPTHMQDLSLGLVELHQVHMDLLLKPVLVPLDGIPSLQCINCTTTIFSRRKG